LAKDLTGSSGAVCPLPSVPLRSCSVLSYAGGVKSKLQTQHNGNHLGNNLGQNFMARSLSKQKRFEL